MTTMTHDGYLATLEVDQDAGVIHGRVINARAILTFEGETLAELQQAFAETIADYRDWCKERGVDPELIPKSLIPGRSLFASRRSFTGALLKWPLRRGRALINSSPIASKSWPERKSSKRRSKHLASRISSSRPRSTKKRLRDFARNWNSRRDMANKRSIGCPW